MNVARARRYWRRWDRYLAGLERLDPNTLPPRGAERAHERLLDFLHHKQLRQASAACLLVGAVLAAYVAPTRKGGLP